MTKYQRLHRAEFSQFREQLQGAVRHGTVQEEQPPEGKRPFQPLWLPHARIFQHGVQTNDGRSPRRLVLAGTPEKSADRKH